MPRLPYHKIFNSTMQLSIITINKNNAAGLYKTIQSVRTQTFNNFEYLVIDGDSQDSSVDIIRAHADKINYWVSEKDSGIYNAMNKGIRKAQGKYCLFLNSGDCLIDPSTLNNIFKEIEQLDDADIYYSDRIGTDGTLLKSVKYININNLIEGGPSHQNSLIRTSFFPQYGYYNENFKIISDWEFFLKACYFFNARFVHINTLISIVDTNGISHSERHLLQTEQKVLLNDVFGSFSKSVLELLDYRKSVYGNIVKNWGNTQFLDFILKSYRYIIRRIKKNNNLLTNNETQ
jgi:glycosyltransferase involved in cell wall biosynthesis